jgi:K+-sensing histidine kinase KdpD
MIGSRLFFATFFPAIALAAAFGGGLPGLLALALSLIVVAFFFLPAPSSLAGSNIDGLQLTVFAVAAIPLVTVALILNAAIHLLFRQQQESRHAHAREARQQELLVLELDHRIRNLLGSVEVIAARTFREDLRGARSH